MIGMLRDMRIVPVAVVATGALLALKFMGLALEGGYMFAGLGREEPTRAAGPVPGPASAPPARKSWAQDVLGFPDVTGSVPAPSSADAAKGKAKVPEAPLREGVPVRLNQELPQSPAERALLERLQERRKEIETRAQEIEARESLLQASEQRLEARLAELKQMEQKVTEAAVRQDESEAAKFKTLVTMYENMKAKDAARIFDRLDMRVLLEVASQINPRRMSDILGQMSPEAAERLTVELANRYGANVKAGGTQQPLSALPKIEGRRAD